VLAAARVRAILSVENATVAPDAGLVAKVVVVKTSASS